MADRTVESDSEAFPTKETQRPRPWTKKKKLIVGGAVALALIIAIAIGLGVGLGLGLNSGGDDGDGGNDGGPTPTGTPVSGPVPTVSPVANPTNVWQPTTRETWDYALGRKVNSTATNGTSVWIVDLFDTSATTISGLQSNGSKVICYFSAGSWENWRSDAMEFVPSDLGKTLDGWPNEKWINVSSNSVRAIMLQRLDLASSKGCDGVDPDNVDGYSNKNGLDLTEDDSVNFMGWLAGAAQSRNMSIGLKNAGDIIPQLLDYMQWSVNEQCLQFNECDTFSPFITANKPVFHVEYPKGDDVNNNDDISTSKYDQICNSAADKGFSTIIKNINLDAFIERC